MKKLPDWVKTSEDYKQWQEGKEHADTSAGGSARMPFVVSRRRDLIAVGALVIFIIIFLGFARIYHGAGVSFKVVQKHSFSYKDTIVNLDDLIGMPKIAAESQHPAVMRQMYELGWLTYDGAIKTAEIEKY